MNSIPSNKNVIFFAMGKLMYFSLIKTNYKWWSAVISCLLMGVSVHGQDNVSSNIVAMTQVIGAVNDHYLSWIGGVWNETGMKTMVFRNIFFVNNRNITLLGGITHARPILAPSGSKSPRNIPQYLLHKDNWHYTTWASDLNQNVQGVWRLLQQGLTDTSATGLEPPQAQGRSIGPIADPTRPRITSENPKNGTKGVQKFVSFNSITKDL